MWFIRSTHYNTLYDTKLSQQHLSRFRKSILIFEQSWPQQQADCLLRRNDYVQPRPNKDKKCFPAVSEFVLALQEAGEENRKSESRLLPIPQVRQTRSQDISLADGSFVPKSAPQNSRTRHQMYCCLISLRKHVRCSLSWGNDAMCPWTKLRSHWNKSVSQGLD